MHSNKLFSTSLTMSRPKSAAVKNIGIDIANIFGSEISINIDIGKGSIDQLYSTLCGLSA